MYFRPQVFRCFLQEHFFINSRVPRSSWGLLRLNLGHIGHPKRGPRAAQERPRPAQHRSKSGQERANRGQVRSWDDLDNILGPSWASLGHLGAPKVKRKLRTQFVALLGGHVGPSWASNMAHKCPKLGARAAKRRSRAPKRGPRAPKKGQKRRPNAQKRAQRSPRAAKIREGVSNRHHEA